MRKKASSAVAIPAVLLFVAVASGCSPQTVPEPAASSSPPSASATAFPTGTGTPTATASPTATVSPTATDTYSATVSPTSTVSPTATVTATETITVVPSPTETSASPWTTFITADGTLAFDLPSGWTVLDPAGELAEGGGTFAEVRNEAKKLLATLRTNMATGSTCLEKYPYSVLESQELPALEQNGTVPRFIYETRGNAIQSGPANTPAAAYGITSAPLPDGDSTCAIFQFFTWPPNAAMFGAFYNPANNQTPGDQSLPYLELAKKYAQTAEYQDIKRMITSLRPAD